MKTNLDPGPVFDNQNGLFGFLGFILFCNLSWFCDDQPDLQRPARLPSTALDPADAPALVCECSFHHKLAVLQTHT